MKIEATVTIPSATDALFDSLEAEKESGIQSERTKTTITRDGDDLICTISSSDATAFRASANSLAKLLITFEQMQGVDNGRADEGEN